VAEAAGLGRNFPSFNEFLIAVHSSFNSTEGVVNRVHTEECVTGAVGETFAVGNFHTFYVVGGVVRLKTERKSVRCTAGSNTSSVDGEFSCTDHKVERRHKFGNSCNNLRRKACCYVVDLIAGYVVIKDEFTKFCDSPVFDFIINGEVNAVLDNTGYRVLFVRSYGVLVDVLNSEVCEPLAIVREKVSRHTGPRRASQFQLTTPILVKRAYGHPYFREKKPHL
jgi:hypothetical protein